MTKKQAKQYWRDHDDDSATEEGASEAFAALYGRAPGPQDATKACGRTSASASLAPQAAGPEGRIYRTPILEAGIHAAVSVEAYHADPCPMPSLSASMCKILDSESPWHAWTAHPRLNPAWQPEEASKIFDLGTVCHALLLEGADVAHVIAALKEGEPVTDWRTKAAQVERDEARARGKIPLLAHQAPEVAAMIQAATAQLAVHKDACNVFRAGKPEQTLTWQEEGGIWCRARLDWLSDSRLKIADYKTTSGSANPETISRLMIASGWDIQAAFYIRGLNALHPPGAYTREFRFVIQETFPPYTLCVVGLAPEWQWSGHSKVTRAIELWRKCLAEDHWPGYPDRTVYPDLPKWEEERITRKELGV